MSRGELTPSEATQYAEELQVKVENLLLGRTRLESKANVLFQISKSDLIQLSLNQLKIYDVDKEELSNQIKQLAENKRQLLSEAMDLEASILQKKMLILQKKSLSTDIVNIISKIRTSASTIRTSIDNLEVSIHNRSS